MLGEPLSVRIQRPLSGHLIRRACLTTVAVGAFLIVAPTARSQPQGRPRAREAGVIIGVFQPGPFNAITDVSGVLVGHATVRAGDSVHTGVTAVLPHSGNLYRSRVPAALFVFNGFGKFVGSTQLAEHGELETPILLTCTLCVWKVADALTAYLLDKADMQDVVSINPVVGETNDAGLSDIRSRPITANDVRVALEGARGGAVEEGAVGAGAGTDALGWKSGIGTSSRRVPAAYGPYTVGVLVQSNFGGILTINGAPVGRELGRYSLRTADRGMRKDTEGQGSAMIVVATDAPLSSLDLQRLARRAILGLSRTGSFGGPMSGDYVVAFSTASSVRRTYAAPAKPLATHTVTELSHDDLAPLFEAVVEATEEAIVNSLFRATATTYRGHTMEALPLDRVIPILEKYHAMHWDSTLAPAAH